MEAVLCSRPAKCWRCSWATFPGPEPVLWLLKCKQLVPNWHEKGYWMSLELIMWKMKFPRSNFNLRADLWHETFVIPCFGPLVWPCLHSQLGALIHPAQLLLNSLKCYNTAVCPVNFPDSSFLPLLFLVPPQCTQGTKGLLESATRPPLLSTSCPQGKPQTAHTCPDNSPTVNSDPSPELSTSCGARHTASSRGHTSPPRHSKSRSKKSKRAALHISNPAYDAPVSPTSPDAGPKSKARGHEGASFSPLHWLTWMAAFSSENTPCLKLACCNTVRYKWYEFKIVLSVGFLKVQGIVYEDDNHRDV